MEANHTLHNSKRQPDEVCRGFWDGPDLTTFIPAAATLGWTLLFFSLIGCLIFLVPVPYRKSLSWNTLRARKRAEAKDVSSVGVRGQENGLLRKPKESTPPAPLASPATRAKGKVSKAGRRRTLVMSYVCAPHLPLAPLGFYFVPLNLCVCTHVCVQPYDDPQ